MNRTLNFLRDQSVLILGLGESGLACASFAAAHGAARVTVADTRSAPPGLDTLRAMAPQCSVKLGAFESTLLADIHIMVVSPGLPPLDPGVAALLAAAEVAGIPVQSEIDWFAQALEQIASENSYTPKIIAITGTNGKTTVTRLAEHLANAAGVKAVACGNVSPSALDALQDALSSNTLPALWVLELSSFQLHYTSKLRAHAATVLNVTQDHLDWHGSMQAYSAAKQRIFSAGTHRILNRDDPLSLQMQDKTASNTFGVHAPSQAGDFGIVEDGGFKWLAQARLADDAPRKKKDAPAEVMVQRLMPADALQIRGSHNHANALAALALLSHVGLLMGPLLRGLREYAGEAHRCAPVMTIDSVDFIDDSKGTNVGATLAAINGLAEGRRRIVLIAGGQGKGQDFAPLKSVVDAWVKAVCLIGQDAPALRSALADCGATLLDCLTLSDAVMQAQTCAVAGDIVLLSPACASLDMFKDYKQRAAVFVDSVHMLAAQQGQPV